MSNDSISTAGILLITVSLVEYGGLSLLYFIRKRSEGYLDNPLRRSFFRAGHAHAGVLVMLALIGMLLVDSADLSDGMKSLVRICLVLPPILMPIGFFLSVVSPTATKPNKLIGLIYLGALSLAIGTLTLGIGLVRVG